MTDRYRRMVLAVLASGLAAMLASALVYTMGDHPLTRHSTASPAPPAEGMQNVPPKEESDTENTAVMNLMQKLQRSPQDVETMLEIAALFASQNNVENAKAMLDRAALTAPSDPRPPYLLGVQFAQVGNWDMAVQSLERSLSLKEDASTLYSLGVILRYHLQQEQKAQRCFEKAAAICADPSLIPMIETELKK